MICEHCGHKNKKKAKFCQECGGSLIAAFPAFDDEAAEFDFTPIGGETEALREPRPENATPEQDEYLVGSDYRAPQPNWRNGDTMEMAPLEGDASRRVQQFRVPEETEKKGRGKLIAILIAATLALAGIGIGGYLFMGGSLPQFWLGSAHALPDVVGMNKDAATELLLAQDFDVKIMEVKSDDVPGIVLLMDPRAGRRLSPGSEVVLQVATPRIIPDIIGKTEEEATDALTKEGFTKIRTVKEKSNEEEGTVLSVDPSAGMVAKASMTITMVIAEPYTVPDVVGMDVDDAVALMQEEGYEVSRVEVYSDLPEGTVVSTDPEAGAQLNSGSTVTLNVAKSRAAELIAATHSYLANVGILTVGGTNYEILFPDSGYFEVTYKGDNTTEATLTVMGITTLPDGEVLRGSAKTRVVSFVWNDDNTLAYVA
ncbi:MAG: PASTA domain-containing protein [Eggerthellaceae bacterium]|nr:PASTA domain-containing protein [Eggerthellaceae bacterium]